MKVYSEISYYWDLYEICWSGAKNTLDIIREHNKEDELMNLLEEIFGEDNPVSETTLNDFLWFDSEIIFESLGIEKE